MVWELQSKGGKITIVDDPNEAAQGADCLVTDTWVSMLSLIHI